MTMNVIDNSYAAFVYVRARKCVHECVFMNVCVLVFVFVFVPVCDYECLCVLVFVLVFMCARVQLNQYDARRPSTK